MNTDQIDVADLSPAEMTLDELRPLVARVLPRHAAFDGWNEAAAEAACHDVGVPASRATLLFPGGATEMIDAWIQSSDADMTQAMETAGLPTGITALLRTAILTRLDQQAGHREAVRRAISILAMPQNALMAARTLWRTADTMWRIAGDSATDFNHYTKRMTLGAVYSATLLVWLDDDSENAAETRAFLERRLADVGRFEKAKAQWSSNAIRRPSLARFLGRLRYPPA